MIFSDAREIARMLRAKEVSAREVLAAHLAQIERCNPEVNAVVRDSAGGWLLEGDLVWRNQRVIGEYQGEVHASRRQRSADVHRAGLAAAEGWTVNEIFAEDLALAPRRRATLRRFAKALHLDPSVLRID